MNNLLKSLKTDSLIEEMKFRGFDVLLGNVLTEEQIKQLDLTYCVKNIEFHKQEYYFLKKFTINLIKKDFTKKEETGLIKVTKELKSNIMKVFYFLEEHSENKIQIRMELYI